MISAAVRRLPLLPIVVTHLLGGAVIVPANAWATGSDDVGMIQEYGTHYVGSESDVYLGLEDDSTSCFAVRQLRQPDRHGHNDADLPGNRNVAAVASGPVTPNSGSNMTSTADILWYVGANAGGYDASYAYSGDGQFAAQTVTGSIAASKIATSVSLTQDSYQTYAGQPVTFTAHVAAAQDDPYQIGGTAQLWYGVNPWGSPFTIVNGVGTLTTASLPVSDSTGRTYYVQYLGDGQHDGSESNNVDHRTLPTTPTSVALSVPTPIWTADPPTMSAHVTGGGRNHAAGGDLVPRLAVIALRRPVPRVQLVHPRRHARQRERELAAGRARSGQLHHPGRVRTEQSRLRREQCVRPAERCRRQSAARRDGDRDRVAEPGHRGRHDQDDAPRSACRAARQPPAPSGSCSTEPPRSARARCPPRPARSPRTHRPRAPTPSARASSATRTGNRRSRTPRSPSAPRPSATSARIRNARRRGTRVTVHTRIRNADGTPATGRVTFRQGGGLLGAATLDATGFARISTTALPVGTDTVLAQYSGSARTGPRTLTVQVTIVPA